MLTDRNFKQAVSKARAKFPELFIAPEFSLKAADLGVEGFDDDGKRVDYTTEIGRYRHQASIRSPLHTAFACPTRVSPIGLRPPNMFL